MKLEVTPRDIFLIKFALCVLVLALSASLLVLPGIRRIQESETVLDEVRRQKEEMQEEIDGIDALKILVGQKQEELSALSAPYYGTMENHQVDQLVTGIALEHNLFPMSLDIQEAGLGAVAPYAFISGNGDGSASGPEDASGAAGSFGETDGYLRQISANLTLRGTEGDIQSFLDDIEKNYPAIQIRSFQMDRGVYVDTSMELTERISMSCELAVYSCPELDGRQTGEVADNGSES